VSVPFRNDRYVSFWRLSYKCEDECEDGDYECSWVYFGPRISVAFQTVDWD